MTTLLSHVGHRVHFVYVYPNCIPEIYRNDSYKISSINILGRLFSNIKRASLKHLVPVPVPVPVPLRVFTYLVYSQPGLAALGGGAVLEHFSAWGPKGPLHVVGYTKLLQKPNQKIKS